MPEIKIVTAVCAGCRRRFTVRVTDGNSPRRTCSPGCYNRATRERAAARKEKQFVAPPPKTIPAPPPQPAIIEPEETRERRAMKGIRYEDEPTIPATDGRRSAWR